MDCPECAARGLIYQLACDRCYARMMSRMPRKEIKAYLDAIRFKQPDRYKEQRKLIREEHEADAK